MDELSGKGYHHKVTDLYQSWERAWNGVEARGDGEPIFRLLVARYSEPHRKYHSQEHLIECLDAFEAVRDVPPHPTEAEAALWFHDAIYDVRGRDNEEQSANWATSVFTEAGVSSSSTDLIQSLILVTRHTALPATLDEQLLVDIDLSILGAPRVRFDEYERQIREEYSYVPGFLFRRKRRAILRTFLDRARIYSTGHFYNALEQRARENLERAIPATRFDPTF